MKGIQSAKKETCQCRAEMGAVGEREMMEMTPCDIFSYIRGRTVWLVGDSMMQVCCRASHLYIILQLQLWPSCCRLSSERTLRCTMFRTWA